MRDLKNILKVREPFYKQAHLDLNTSGKTIEASFDALIIGLNLREQPLALLISINMLRRSNAVCPFKKVVSAPAGSQFSPLEFLQLGHECLGGDD